MRLYSETEQYKLYNGNMLDMLEVIEPNSIDSIVCDPPYELNFMSKGWDNSGIAFNKDAWKQCHAVLKEGGYLLAFGGSRTFHRIACAIEDAGFEIRDCIMWLYGSGFPKSLDIGKAIDKKNGVQPIGRKEPTGGITGGNNTGATQKGWHDIKNWYEYPECQNAWKGWGTALKPAYEPIIVARKPFKGSLIENIEKYGVGGLNIDECRVEPTGEDLGRKNNIGPYTSGRTMGLSSTPAQDGTGRYDGRFPANVIHDGSEEVLAGMPDTKSTANVRHNNNSQTTGQRDFGKYQDCDSLGYDDEGNASRYFYCAKASKKDRDEGLDLFEQKQVNDGRNTPIDNAFQRGETLRKNIHPTVKPIELMQYLVRLVTPRGGKC